MMTMMLLLWMLALSCQCWFVEAALASATSENCTWVWVEQPLDHFRGGQDGQATFRERVCVFERFYKGGAVMLFYTGNESPVDLYVNNTGLMWQLAEEFEALLVFAEHRYFGESVPKLNGTRECFSYLTSAQALADYAALIPQLMERYGMVRDTAKVVAFGGSYGGMLSAWFRTKYPHIVTAGAVAASAPIWGFAPMHPELDGSFRFISGGAETDEGAFDQQCQDSYLAAWVLIDYLWKARGKDYLVRALNLCDGEWTSLSVIQYFQQVLFLLAESNYPFPSDYIVYSIINIKGLPLPSWPMRKACNLIRNSEVKIRGNRNQVDYTIQYGDHLTCEVDWNRTDCVPTNSTIEKSRIVSSLLDGISKVYGMIFNITGTTTCYPSSASDKTKTKATSETCMMDSVLPLDAWGILVCNEGLNLVQDMVSGIGNDMYWPPTIAKSDRNVNHDHGIYRKIIATSGELDYCKSYSQRGFKGVTSNPSPFGEWEWEQYGGKRIGKFASNIIFSNGKYDPWSAAGVLKDQNPTLKALFLQQGGHHTDLMWPTKDDPDSIKQIREEERATIRGWINTPDPILSED